MHRTDAGTNGHVDAWRGVGTGVGTIIDLGTVQDFKGFTGKDIPDT
jgi:hypothetical protein